jgi:ATP-binding protein involved in chromosome partitioning
MSINSPIVSHAVKPGLALVPGIKNIIAVASGKGGVGKSTTAVNLALALRTEGAQVGILDADIYGPNQPHMLASVGQQPEKNAKGLQPIICHGLQSMSMAYMIDPETPMIWRGPMVSQALQQLLNETEWKNLDYLIIDLPPGTGDIQLTLAQKVPVTAAVIVTTPQDIALLDARKAIEMFKKVNIPILGIIENMSVYHCKQCGHQEYIFGSKGADKLGATTDCESLGALPLDIKIRQQADEGKPIVIAEPESSNAKIYGEIARKVAAKLALLPKNYAAKFPNIIVEK